MQPCREFQIMYRCPFPGHWQPLHGCYVQSGELLLSYLGYWKQTHFYEHARRIGDYGSDIVLYSYDDARAMCQALQGQHPHMEFMLLRYVGDAV